ncbi:MAG TPA: SsrA-binding protein SmpB [Thermomicrobiales bacterium]|nr:SsrA-binding protein SmpB [Thermomicrobiales bacterium]
MAKKGKGSTKEAPSGDRVVTQNRRAFHEYFIEDQIEAGMVLTGTEIKSVREGKITIAEAYVRIDNGELWLIGSHITPYSHGSYLNHDPDRPRKLLAHKREIERLREAIEQKGMTLVPLRIVLKRGRAKVDVGVARGKKLWDKRQSEAARDAKRQIDRAMRERV